MLSRRRALIALLIWLSPFILIAAHHLYARVALNFCDARGVVEIYYQSLNMHDYPSAKACLSPEYVRKLKRPTYYIEGTYLWWDIISITRLKASRERDGSASEYFSVLYIGYPNSPASPRRYHTATITVRKDKASSPWRIADIYEDNGG